MKIGEVSLNTNDVVALAHFYKQLFGIENGSTDAVHQVLIDKETMLTIYQKWRKLHMIIVVKKVFYL